MSKLPTEKREEIIAALLLEHAKPRRERVSRTAFMAEHGICRDTLIRLRIEAGISEKPTGTNTVSAKNLRIGRQYLANKGKHGATQKLCKKYSLSRQRISILGVNALKWDSEPRPLGRE